jgi:hypothetical protein
MHHVLSETSVPRSMVHKNKRSCLHLLCAYRDLMKIKTVTSAIFSFVTRVCCMTISTLHFSS